MICHVQSCWAINVIMLIHWLELSHQVFKLIHWFELSHQVFLLSHQLLLSHRVVDEPTMFLMIHQYSKWFTSILMLHIWSRCAIWDHDDPTSFQQVIHVNCKCSMCTAGAPCSTSSAPTSDSSNTCWIFKIFPTWSILIMIFREIYKSFNLFQVTIT